MAKRRRSVPAAGCTGRVHTFSSSRFTSSVVGLRAASIRRARSIQQGRRAVFLPAVTKLICASGVIRREQLRRLRRELCLREAEGLPDAAERLHAVLSLPQSAFSAERRNAFTPEMRRAAVPHDALAPRLPWQAVRPFRDVLRHAYDQVDPARIWEIATRSSGDGGGGRGGASAPRRGPEALVGWSEHADERDSGSYHSGLGSRARCCDVERLQGLSRITPCCSPSTRTQAR